MRNATRKITYLATEGRRNIPTTAKIVLERAVTVGPKKVVVFTSDGSGVRLLANECKEADIKLLAVTFPHGQKFLRQVDGKEILEDAKSSDPAMRAELEGLGATWIQGTMPFQTIVIPGDRDTKTESIRGALGLVSGGLVLCVQAVLMGTDAGYIESGEEVIAMAADTAIVATGARTAMLFHPLEGLQIREILCKPLQRRPLDE